MSNFIFTGGGTAGHVTPNIALIPLIQQRGYTVHYIGTESGIERGLVENLPGVTYHGISAGKLRRYSNIKNLTDPFRVVKGYFQALSLLRRLQPAGVFSKGGFVAVPVVLAARHLHIPIVIHESDMTPGLATRLSIGSAQKVCVTFARTADFIGPKAVYTGSPIRYQLLSGQCGPIRERFGFDSKPVVLAMGGSLGARAINTALREALPRLLPEFNVIHICGKGNLNAALENRPGYRQLEYSSEELPDIMACASFVISRAGANSINEFLALRKPMLLIPLPKANSRGDQIDNAHEFAQEGFARVLSEEELTPARLQLELKELFDRRQTYIAAMEKTDAAHGTENVLKVILACVH